jgi:phytoene dehydrogenase-like protein
MTAERDVIVVGGGHNGLVAAAYLARAGMDVLVAERNERVGGAVVSAELTRPGFVHDLFATNMNLFCGSPAFAELGEDLARHGLSFATTSRPYASAFPDGVSLRVYQDTERTRSLLASHDPRDAAGWESLRALYERYAPILFEIYGTEIPSADAVRKLAKASRDIGSSGLTELAQLVARSTRSLGDAYFKTREAKAMLAAWGMHLDFGPDVATGAMFPFLELFADMDNGMSVVAGGASGLPQALAALVREAGSEVRTGAPVREVLVDRGRAVGVELSSGERFAARRAVVANLTPGVLFGRVLPPDALTEGFRRRVNSYVYGPGTMMVHAALDGPVPWAGDDDLRKFGYVHIGPYVEEMAATYTQALDGHLPASPLLVVGQTTAIDPARAPEGRQVLWVQVRMLPARIEGDAGDRIKARSWEQAKEPYAERVLEKLEGYAPGVGDRILEWKALGPDDLERENENLIGGDSVGGSHHLFQNGPLPASAGLVALPDPGRSPLHGGSRNLARGGRERDLRAAGGSDDRRRAAAQGPHRRCRRGAGCGRGGGASSNAKEEIARWVEASMRSSSGAATTGWWPRPTWRARAGRSRSWSETPSPVGRSPPRSSPSPDTCTTPSRAGIPSSTSRRPTRSSATSSPPGASST